MLKMIKLLLGSVFFVALCILSMMLMVLLLATFDGQVHVRSFISMLLVLGGLVFASFALYALAQPAEPPEASVPSKSFKRRKLLFQLAIILLIGLIILSMPMISRLTIEAQTVASALFIVLLWSYKLLARKLWRCAACEEPLPIIGRSTGRSSVKYCPNCNALLQ